MMRVFLIATALLLAAVAPATADTFTNCTKAERGKIIAAYERAERLTLTATTAIGPNPAFNRWFGSYNAKNGEQVRRVLKAIVKGLRAPEIGVVCLNIGQELCDRDTYAFVEKSDPYNVSYCPAFFEMDTMKTLTNDSIQDGSGTRAGTVVHEFSHFSIVGDTEDLCYARDVCTEMARTSSEDAIHNADSFQYFVEDVTYFGVAGESFAPGGDAATAQ